MERLLEADARELTRALRFRRISAAQKEIVETALALAGRVPLCQKAAGTLCANPAGMFRGYPICQSCRLPDEGPGGWSR